MYAPLSLTCILMLAASPVWFALAQQSSEAGAFSSDRDKTGLRGPVKTMLEERTFSLPDGQQLSTTTTKYTPDGRILEQRMKNSDGSEWVVSYTYHSDGRLLHIVSGKPGSGDSSETTYLYDEEQRLIGMKSADKIQSRYKYDEKGHKSVIESYSSDSPAPNTAYATHWEGTDLGFVPSPGGRCETSYNEKGVATGARFYDAEGKLLGHIVRQFDGEGRISAEQQSADAPQMMFPEEVLSKLNPEQIKSVGTFIAAAQNRAISYSYDAQGRVKEEHKSGGMMGEQVTITTYNDRGDKASERTTLVMSPDRGPYHLTEAGAFIPAGQPKAEQPPVTSETQYTYQYDTYGNWTEQNIVSRSQPGEAFGAGTVIRRKLTYY